MASRLRDEPADETVPVLLQSEPGATLDESLDDCRIVGVCDVSRHEFDLPTHSLAPDYALYLTALAVHPALRRRGVASSLLEAVDAHARSEKLEQVILHAEDDNDAAIAFYERAGFERVREIPNYYRIEGEDYACYVYARFLDRARRAPGAAPSLWLASSLAGLVPAAFRSCFKRRLW